MLPMRIGALPWARTAGAARLDANAAPTELFMNVRRDTAPARELCFFMLALPRRQMAAVVILSAVPRGSLEAFQQGRPPFSAEPRCCGGTAASIRKLTEDAVLRLRYLGRNDASVKQAALIARQLGGSHGPRIRCIRSSRPQ